MLAARKPGEKRFLMLSAWYFHKNFGILNPLAAELERRGLNHIRIVLTLPPDIFAEKFSEQAKKYLINHGPVPPAQAPGLYAECDFTFTPTLVECFTATYPEAMIMRKPVITSDLPFAHTICRDAALYFNPKNAASIADTIEKLTGSSELQAQLINNGIKQLEQFTDPPARAAAYLRICQNMIK
jgi:glycosyltransferase involved in cell wall biosynthesis